MNIGNRLVDLRKGKNLTQAQLAKALCVTQGYVAQMERGSKIPSLIMGQRLAEIFGCDISDLFD